MPKQRGSKPAKNRARSSNPRIATALARSRLNVHVIDGSWANERNGGLERLKYDREMLVDFIGTMRVYWIGVFVCILSCLVIIIYLYKKNADYRTHDKWQFRLVFHFPQVLIALSIIFEIIATGVIFASKREVEKMSEEIQMEISAQKRKLDLYFRQQMEVS